MSDLSTENNVLSTQYWSDAVHTRIALVDDVLRQVPPSALTDTAAFDLVDGEMAAIRRALRAIGTRRNALTPTCRIPTDILGEIFLVYQQLEEPSPASSASAPSSIPDCVGGHHADAVAPARHSLRSTALCWVPGIAHVCRHWRVVALEHPRLWSDVMLRLGREWALRMLALSKSSPISISLSDPDPCETSILQLVRAQQQQQQQHHQQLLDPVDVLAQHLFHIQELDLTACSCSILPSVRLLETAAPLLEVLWLRVEAHHRPGTAPRRRRRHDDGDGDDIVVPLPHNFLATHPRLRRLIVDGAFIASWATPPSAPLPLSALTLLSICSPDPRKKVAALAPAPPAPPAPAPAPPTTTTTTTTAEEEELAERERLVVLLPTQDEFLDCIAQMPALETLVLAHCLPPFAPAYSARTATLPRLRTLNIHDRVDRCRQVLDALEVPSTTTIKVSCWSVRPPSEHDCLRILPSLSAHLCRGETNDGITNRTRSSRSSSGGGPHALSLSSTSIDGHTEFALAAWRAFVPPTLAEDREQYFGPKSAPDVRLECEWDASDGDPEMERRALRRACAGVPLDELRALSVCAEAAVWDARDWYDTFVSSVEITHVAALESPGESVLDALDERPPLLPPINIETDGSGSNAEGGDQQQQPPPPPPPPLFPEMVSLTLAGVNFVRASEAVWQTLSSAMAKRQASPACVTILDRLELRGCTVAEWMVDSLNEFAAVVVWDSVTDPDNWMHVPREVVGEDVDEDEDEGEGEDESD